MENLFKQTLKNNIVTSEIIKLIHKWYFSILYLSSPVLASKYIYRRNTGKILNLKSPKDFNQKLQWLKLYWRNPLVVQCADKYGVREYAVKSGCEEILPKLYGVYEHTSEINWDKLPNKFALKCTHGCGFNIISDNKNKLDKNQTFKQLDEWLKIRIEKKNVEIHYSKIKPRIICEQYIETDAGFLPIDYKILCFNGKPKLLTVCTDRFSDLKVIFLDLNWEIKNYSAKEYFPENLPVKPECFDEMIQYSEILAKPFPFVRVDFYVCNGKPILGEMTFTPGACMGLELNNTGLEVLGDMIKLPIENEKLVFN